MNIRPSKRLSYEVLTAADAPLLADLDSDTEVMKYINGGVAHTLEDIEKNYLPRLSAFSFPDKGWGLWKVIENNSGQFVGWVLSRPMGFFDETMDEENLEIGWRFKRDHWGKGYGTESAQSLVDALREQNMCRKVTAIALEGNLGSIGIMKKIGMHFVKTDVHEGPTQPETCVFYEMNL